MANIIDTINEYLLNTEKFNDEFLPLRDILIPIKNDLSVTLEELRKGSQSTIELSDRIFYINRYVDLIERIESIFEMRSKRLQQTLQTLIKLSPNIVDNKENEIENNEDYSLTPEQCNAIIKIIKN